MDSIADAKDKLGDDLRDALKNQSLEVYYQPIVRIDDRSLSGFEALVRWLHPSFGAVSTDAFIPLAEALGLTTALDHFVLETACHQLSIWHQASPQLTELKINVNVSSDQFLDRPLIQEVEKVLSKNKLDPKSLNLEIIRSIATFTRPVRNASKSRTTQETPVTRAYLPQCLLPTGFSEHDPMHSDQPE